MRERTEKWLVVSLLSSSLASAHMTWSWLHHFNPVWLLLSNSAEQKVLIKTRRTFEFPTHSQLRTPASHRPSCFYAWTVGQTRVVVGGVVVVVVVVLLLHSRPPNQAWIPKKKQNSSTSNRLITADVFLLERFGFKLEAIGDFFVVFADDTRLPKQKYVSTDRLFVCAQGSNASVMGINVGQVFMRPKKLQTHTQNKMIQTSWLWTLAAFT